MYEFSSRFFIFAENTKEIAMANVKKIRQSVLGALLAIAGLNIYAACYGPGPERFSEDRVISGVVSDESGAPINGIQVSLNGDHFALTDEEGKFCNLVISNSSLFELSFNDIDGQKNGGLFEGKTISVTVPYEGMENVKVTLKKVK